MVSAAHCGAPISVRYPLVEALVGFLFLGAFVIDVIAGPRTAWGQIPVFNWRRQHTIAIFLALLVAATFIDYDLMIIPDQITVTGMIAGLGTGHTLARGPAGAGVMAGDHPPPGVVGRPGGPVGGCRSDPVRPQEREFCLAPRGDGIGRCHAHGNDRCVSGLAGRGSHFFPGSFPGIDPRGMEVDDVSGKAVERTDNYRAPIAKSLMGLTSAWPRRVCCLCGAGSGRSRIGNFSSRFT